VTDILVVFPHINDPNIFKQKGKNIQTIAQWEKQGTIKQINHKKQKPVLPAAF